MVNLSICQSVTYHNESFDNRGTIIFKFHILPKYQSE